MYPPDFVVVHSVKSILAYCLKYGGNYTILTNHNHIYAICFYLKTIFGKYTIKKRF